MPLRLRMMRTHTRKTRSRKRKVESTIRRGKRTRRASGCWGASGSSRGMVDLSKRCWTAHLREYAGRRPSEPGGRAGAHFGGSMATLTPHTSPRTPRRKPSTRRRAISHLQPHDSHNAALHAIRAFLKVHTAYDAFPVSFRLIVLDTKLNVKKALQCLLLNGKYILIYQYLLLTFSPGVVSAPLWNSDKSKFAGMLTVLDIIHLIQYYYRTATYAYAETDVEKFRLESLRGNSTRSLSVPQSNILS